MCLEQKAALVLLPMATCAKIDMLIFSQKIRKNK